MLIAFPPKNDCTNSPQGTSKTCNVCYTYIACPVVFLLGLTELTFLLLYSFKQVFFCAFQSRTKYSWLLDYMM